MNAPKNVTQMPSLGRPGGHGRLAVACALAVAWLFALALRLWWLQVEQHDHYAEKAVEQQQGVIVLDPPRGTIFDARGRQLALSVEAFSVAADPRRVEDPEATADALAPVLRADRDRLLEKLLEERRFVWLKRKVDAPVADLARDLDLPGIHFLPESKRHYPLGPLAGAVLGYVGLDNSGLAGLEYRYERQVSTVEGRRTVIRDGLADTVLYPSMAASDARPGSDLHLTLDAAIQNIVERELAAAVETHNAKRGSVVVMDPMTGAVLAMASYPGFDPNEFQRYPKATWRNAPIAVAYEPGSTFKMITLAAALEANAVDPGQNIHCGNGGIRLGRTRINDHTPFGVLTVREIMAKSSNVGAIKLGAAAGRERLYSTIRTFGFGRATGVDLPNESAGLLQPLERWFPLTPAYISFGQGLSVTSLQMASAFSVIANGGYLLRPYLVDSVGDAPGVPGASDDADEPRREVVGMPISPSSVRQIRSILEGVVLDGTATAAGVPGYRAAGKTGTAQKAIKGGYAPNRYIASFVGFAPIERPALSIAVEIDEPWPRYHGGEAAAPVFAAVAEQALLYLGVAGDAKVESPWVAPEGGVATASLRGAVRPREPQPAGTVPDLVGLTLREAMVAASAAGFRPEIHGSGFVSSQFPAPGTPAEAAGGEVRLDLTAGAG